MKIDLDAIQARADAATEGPWEVDRNYPFSSNLVGIFAKDVKRYVVQVEDQDYVDDPTSAADAEFIAHARTDAPALLALVRSQQAQIERVRELHAQKFYDKWGRTSETPTEYGGWCNTCGRFDSAGCPTIAALTATEGA